MDSTQRMMRDRIAAILLSPTTRKIDFRLGQWTINADSFARVANALVVGDIQVNVGLQAGHGKSVEAQYNFRTDTIAVPNANYGTTTLGQAGIVHECVHAFVDMQAVSGQSEAANEAAGYLAYMLFLLFSLKTVPTPVVDFGKLSLTIAQSIMNTRGAVVSTKDEMALRAGIAANRTITTKG